MEGGKVGKDESVPTLFRIVPMYWAFSGRTGTLQCFVWIHSCISVFPKLFNCWRAMRHKDSEFNVKNHFHFSPPTIERFIFFLVNDTLDYTALYDLLCTTERTPRFLPISTMPSFFPHISLLLWNLKSQVQHYLREVEDYKRFTTLKHYLKNATKKKHWGELLVWSLFYNEGWWHTSNTWWSITFVVSYDFLLPRIMIVSPLFCLSATLIQQTTLYLC